MDDEEENLVGIDDVYSDDFQTQVLLSDLSVLVEGSIEKTGNKAR